ncbi:class III extradiol ring-cleavage dioxygenase [Aquisalimonas sp.]|uniref:DODA-type extradiol aromatic ring-opening family dioxygenase n=1 Tax=unclassified Aquisalimonas TaxID=2644645 RepID=UPI0025BB0A94|nr:class III extradiol ring-cleavage dioxygenase [Aquisalimonas sp.]
MDYRRLFVAHGAPTLALSDVPAHRFLRELGAELKRPRAIVVISPHWVSGSFHVRSPERFRTWHDFAGFPDALYRIRYEPPGDAELARRVVGLLESGGLETGLDQGADMDHGAWVPLSLVYPDADVPVVQVALQADAGPEGCLALGRALSPLAEDDVLLLGSGSIVHNLGDIHPERAAPAPWASAFDRWVASQVEQGDWAAVANYRALAPEPERAHPEDDHFLPLLTALGAGSRAVRLHDSFTYGTISMASYGVR